MLISTFLSAFGRVLPLDLAMPNDPVGIQVMPNDAELGGIAVAYELNEHIVRTASAAGANLIVAFHPLIYPSVQRITQATRVERCIVELIRAGISLYITHTAFDAHPEGTSALLAHRLGLSGVRPLMRHAVHTDAGMGAIGSLAAPTELGTLAAMVREACGAAAVRVSHNPTLPHQPMVRHVAIVGGSGMSMYDAAVSAGADALVTADIRYHGFHAANDAIPVLDPGHAESELFVVDGMCALVRRALQPQDVALGTATIPVIPINDSTNPVRFVV